MKKIIIPVCCVLGLLMCASHTVGACEKGRSLYQKAMEEKNNPQRILLLKESLAACEDFAAWYELARCHERNQDYQTAEDALRHARQTAGSDKAQARVLYRMGILYEKTNRQDQAYCFYKAALEKQPTPKALARMKQIDADRMENGMSVATMTKTLSMPSRAWGVRPSLTLYITFDYDADQPNEKGKQEAIKLGQALTDPSLTGNNFILIGHTDSQGEAAYNLDLSRRRAQAVKEYLLHSFNLPPQCLETRGDGETNLRYAPESTQQDYALNRRVEIQIE